MSDPRRCPQCSAPLSADSPEGLCPKCLLQLGFESQAGPASSGHAGPTVYQPRFIPPTVEELAARFPQLEILEEIGHGGMGVVYKARQKDLDRLVALKILRPDIAHDPAFADRFVREARALGKLSHPAIVTVYDFGRSDGLFFLVMEYVDGANLRQLERTGKLTPAEALRIVPAICEALQYAHDQGVVHRDIKPENILIDTERRVKIADFGLAKMVGAGPDAATLTGAWHVMGTPHYMAPEQMHGAHAVDHRADIYSLGVVIYEMLTGELPVGRFPLPSQKVQVDVRLDEVVLRALEHEPQRRYQRVTEIKTDVELLSSRAPRAAERAEKHDPAPTTGDGPTIPAALRHAFGFWSRPQPGYDRRVGWPVMGALALWLVTVVSLIGLNLAGAPIDARVINVVLIAGIAGLPALLIVLTLAYLVRSRGDVHAGAADGTGGSAAATDRSTTTAAPGTALIAVGVFEWLACWLSCLLFAVVALSGDRELPAIFKSRETLQVLLPVVAVLGAALSAIVILAGLKMRRLESRPFAIAGSILAMFVSPGNVIGLPIGLWALYVLTRPEVKAAFRIPGSASGAPTDSTQSVEVGRKRLHTASDALFVLAAVLAVTGLGVLVWLWQVDVDLLSHQVATMLVEAATMHLICAALIGAAAACLRHARKRLAGLVVLIVVGVFLPAVVALNVVMEYEHIPAWPVMVPAWLGVPVCAWAAARLFRPDVRAAFEQGATTA